MTFGYKTGGGSRLGRRNLYNKEVRAMILTALSDVGGAKYLRRQAEVRPEVFLELVKKSLPRDELVAAITPDKEA